MPGVEELGNLILEYDTLSHILLCFIVSHYITLGANRSSTWMLGDFISGPVRGVDGAWHRGDVGWYIHIYIHIYIYTHIYLDIQICMYKYICVCVYIHIYLYLYLYLYLYVCMSK